MSEFSDHFNAAAKVVEEFSPNHATTIDSIEDRSYEEVDILGYTFENGLGKFEIDVSNLDISARWLRSEFMLHGYNVHNIKDLRFKNDIDPDRLLIVVTEDADPVEREIAQNS